MPAEISVLAAAIAVLSGGLAGAILTLSVQGFVRWWNIPVLAIVFRGREPGCRVPTHAWSGDEQCKPHTDPQVKPVAIHQQYLRLKIENRGNTFHKNVSACVTNIRFSAPGYGERAFPEEVFDLQLARTGGTVFNLASEGHRFLDLVHTEDTAQGHSLSFDFVKASVRLAQMGFGAGIYMMKVFVSAENAASISDEVTWSYEGPLGGVKIVDR
jgi:hypothetical protein